MVKDPPKSMIELTSYAFESQLRAGGLPILVFDQASAAVELRLRHNNGK